MRAYTILTLVTFLFTWVEIGCVPSKTGNTKQGLCPKPGVLLSTTAPCDNKCVNDSDCSKYMKCCDTGCGHLCVYAERAGFCPYNDLPVTDGEVQKPKCKSDFGCRRNTKCCERGSSLDCLPASKEKPGRCPIVNDTNSNLNCTTDRDCSENLKCCGQRCMTPEKVTHVAVPLH